MSLIWFIYKPKFISTSILIEINDSPVEIKKKICEAFELNPTLNIRLRNRKGNLMPLNNSLRQNSRKRSYRVEVFIPAVRTPVPVPKFFGESRLTTAYATGILMNNLSVKLARLESNFKYKNPHLEESFKNKIKEVENRLEFIENRFLEVKNSKWHGIFKRPLLW